MKNRLAKMTFFFITCLFTAFLNSSLYAAETLPVFTTTLTDKVADDNTAIGETNVFTKDTPIIYIAFKSSDVSEGQVVKIEWIAVDTKNAAPANYKIDEKSITVPAMDDNSEDFIGKFSLSKPTNGWPLGTYRADIYVDNKIVKSLNFSIK